MFEYLTGAIVDTAPTYIVIDVNGVGYRLACANPFHWQVNPSDKVKVYVYQAVREDAITLYGFVSAEEKQLFMQLINVSGIGPKSALAILANPDHQGLIDAIANDNVGYLTKFPGIGKKTAGQIVLDLHDKIDQLRANEPLDFNVPASDIEMTTELRDALAALTALGYPERSVKKVQKALSKEPAMSTDDYLRQGLRLLS
ncbi:Holliday junction branch migration protein RuvA [Limosilactobacillus allomucosae]|uniref:Holliday junction branch migration protein RuvA n=1 Tax=Limosilactobacillus allomucosae TaxID=3142938 RepID=UPI003266FE83